MSIAGRYEIRSVSFGQIKEWLLYKHYAKRIPPIDYSYGLYEGEMLKGIITYGTPASSNLRGLFQPKYNLIELNRLCVSEGIERNSLSYFVGYTLRILQRPCVIVSYADTAQNHHGYIYQATNWIYTGLSAKRTDWKIKGMEHLHGATIADMSRGKENRAEYMREVYGENFYLEDRSRKHRYFYFIGNKKQVTEMRSMLPYQVCEYPKGDNKRYDASYKPSMQTKLNLF